MDNNISKFYKSFSGTDSLAFAVLPNATPILLGSLTTVSYSMFRDKRPVPLIGKINIGGFTRGTRIYAGTMIFTMINQHWANELLEQIPWLKSYGRIKADELPLFDLMVISANEYGASAQMFIYGVDITDEGQVLSIEDLFTENQISFIARDLDVFYNCDIPKTEFNGSNTITKINSFDLQYNNSINSNELYNQTILTRTINYSNSDMMTGNDILDIQNSLNTAGFPIDLTSIYDPKTYEAIKMFQASVGIPITGNVDDYTWNALQSSSGINSLIGIVISKSGANVYSEPTTSSTIVYKLNYKDTIVITEVLDKWYKFDKGYVSKDHIYSNSGNTFDEFDTINKDSSGSEVNVLQSALNNAMETNISITGVMDAATEDLILKFKETMGLTLDVSFDKDDWIILQEIMNGSLTGNLNIENFIIEYLSTPRKNKFILENFQIEDEGIICKNITGKNEIKVSTVSYYNNNKSKEYSIDITFEAGQVDFTIGPMLLQDAFIYNEEFKSLPVLVEFIILIHGSKTLKWIYDFV